jgi:serine protease inhibitor
MKKTISILISIIMIAGLLAGCVNPDGNRSTGIGGNKQASFDLSKIDSGLIGGNEIFAFNIFQKINSEDGDKSIFISPLSISTALAMTYNGARTTTAEAMAEALQYKGIELENLDIGYKNLLAYLNNVDPKVQLNISNSIWFRKGEEIRSDFLSTNKDNFNAYISEIDFQDIKAADTINDWISKATKSKIDKMIEPPISPDVIMYLIILFQEFRYYHLFGSASFLFFKPVWCFFNHYFSDTFKISYDIFGSRVS